jgi:bifunctional non-homologous end joining protein LigD
MNAADWTERFPRVVEEAARLKRNAVLDCEVICSDENGRADFDRLLSRCFEHEAIARAFDLLRLEWWHAGAAQRPKGGAQSGSGIQYVAHCDMDRKPLRRRASSALRASSKRLTAPYKSGLCRSWIKVRNPKSPANLRIIDGTF